jgi:hydroxypyruvate isomerase
VIGRHLGTVLIEPSRSPESGPTDYPVQTIADAHEIIDSTPGTGLLADLWHLAGTVGDKGITDWLECLRWNGRLPAHVQLADDPGRCVPESGVLPLDAWLCDLEAVGYTGEVAGEWMW